MKNNLLHTVVFSFSFSLFNLSLHSQWVSMPNNSLIGWMNLNFPGCVQGNSIIGWQLDTTCPAMLNIHIMDFTDGCPISNLRGIEYFDNLDTLLCGWGCLNSVPALPNSLVYFDCADNLLDSLPPLPNNLTYLDCNNNRIRNLPALPNSLTVLDCGSNIFITSLPTLPGSLKILDCSDNQITSLPTLPGSLTSLACGHNQITSLPTLPGSITRLLCENNALTSLPELPDSMNYCWIQNNPLTCLPKLKRIVSFSFVSTNITCLPNYGNVTTSVPALNTLPLCYLSNNIHGCQVFNIIEPVRNPKSSYRIPANIHHNLQRP